MRRKKQHNYYADDQEYAILKAAAKRRSVSEYVLSCALAEAKRHTPVEDLKALVHQIVLEEIENRLPARGNVSEKDLV